MENKIIMNSFILISCFFIFKIFEYEVLIVDFFNKSFEIMYSCCKILLIENYCDWGLGGI